jgi:transposase
MAKNDLKIKTLKESGSFNPHPERVKAPWFQKSTFFDPKDFVQIKYEMLRHASIDGTSKSEAAKLFGISRPTFYETESAFSKNGFAGLLPQKRGPRDAHKINANIMMFIETYISKNQKIKTKELVELVRLNFNISVHPRSIERAISRKKKSQNKKLLSQKMRSIFMNPCVTNF